MCMREHARPVSDANTKFCYESAQCKIKRKVVKDRGDCCLVCLMMADPLSI